MANEETQYGFAANLSRTFINSKLTPLLIIATVMLGLFSLSLTPREEEPQIIVPMIDIMVMYPGASPEEVETLIEVLQRDTTLMAELMAVCARPGPATNDSDLEFHPGSGHVSRAWLHGGSGLEISHHLPEPNEPQS